MCWVILQMRNMTRELSRMENQFLAGPVGGNSISPLTSLTDRSIITPKIVDENGERVAQYNFDVRGFKQDDVNSKLKRCREFLFGALLCFHSECQMITKDTHVCDFPGVISVTQIFIFQSRLVMDV
jgi:hypothetical protein